MELVLKGEKELKKRYKAKNSFYTVDEIDLLYKLENGLVETKSQDQVMENLRHRLGLTEK
ncbi:hypothetical protein ACLS0F_02040 [Avibacterium endocarditidis]|uniref:Uncharacterized protein n=1 Tax=Avibacterium endocarditidis TaxID=380674 RepID=A0ABX4ZQK1_9PAST|nr:hypothetical protein [Avibacterium endocarditidis]POY41741.1 hypothetical protein C3Z13_10330 [Avibacterium endocarditidis]